MIFGVFCVWCGKCAKYLTFDTFATPAVDALMMKDLTSHLAQNGSSKYVRFLKPVVVLNELGSISKP